jgi:hypothetical protein
MKEYLQEKGNKVYNMLLHEFNLKKAQEVWYHDGREEGAEDILLAIDYLRKGYSVVETAKLVRLPEDTVKKLNISIQTN